MAEINGFNRVYQLQPKDIFCVNVQGFLKTPILWSHSYQIVGTDEYKRKHWWQFWKPRKVVFVKIMYLGDDKDE